MTWIVTFYSERVRRTIADLPNGILSSYLRLVAAMEIHGPNLGMPHSRAMGDGLFELRASGREGIARVFYCTQIGHRIVILHSFVKKTQTTPNADLHIARKRQQEIRHE